MTQSDRVKQEMKDVRRNYTRTPNILFESYPDLHPQEKWLFINLVYLCGAQGTRHLSIRYIAQKTGISAGALSGSKDPAKGNPGMLRNLHAAGLIHAEIKKRKLKDGSETDQAQYHITIVDIWQLNELFFSERSENEHLDNKSVQIPNTYDVERSENERERSENERERSENERERSDFDTNIRLDNKTTNKTTEKEVRSAAVAATTPHTQEQEDVSILDLTRVSGPDGDSLDDSRRAQGHQERTGKEQPKRSGTRSTQGTRTSTPVAPAITLSKDEQAFYDLYCSLPFIKVPPPITYKVKEQCARYARVFQTQEQLFSLKNWMSKQAFFKGKGFSLSLMGLAINDWAMEQVDAQGTKTPAQPAISEEEKQEKLRKAQAARASLLANKPVAVGGAR